MVGREKKEEKRGQAKLLTLEMVHLLGNPRKPQILSDSWAKKVSMTVA